MKETLKKLLLILNKKKEILEVFSMTKNIKNRINTSIFLFILLFLMVINNFILAYFLIIGGILALLEFFEINKIIYKKKIIKQFFYNLLFIIYIFIFCSFFLFFSSFLNLKILIFLVLIACIFSDIGGFIFGKIFGGKKLISISPNKTFSGAFGSIIFSITIFSLSIYYLTKSFDPYLIIIGFIISLSCQIGDLFFSYLKRKSLLKDTGNFLPGHGGILDRIDGILLGLPTGLLSLLIIY
jgi:phosphatidate cytidylyltransferase